ncbi:retrovirus-related Pol polyprotein from transposon 17.6 [Trichonephila inaurata madagascariensis]|uniref:Retrovirus-related Pol polyprotein from transposon 17.6 n=1 Tax=Trichonephila inaurata madagascariensis TaxID=2747483 RepID=A0A8X6YPG3_9ARAC|nr:retrovirus-related Pol polyprotein from transposon 17.6 [Trichonephila inaurata madagascariensis]
MPRTRQEEPPLVQPATGKFNLIELIPNYEGSESIGIRRFLNKINDVAELGKWSKRYIKNFAKRALPLTNLLRKDIPFEWASETQAAFEDIKEAILNPPVLALPDPAADLQITTDASSYGIGAVLEQKTLCQGHFRCIGSSLHHERNPYKIQISPVYHYKAEFVYGGTASQKLKTVTTLHLAFARLEEPLQGSEPTGLPLQGLVTAWSNCISIMLRTVTLRFTQPQESSRRLGRVPVIPFFFLILPFKTWTVVHDQEFASAQRKDDRTVGSAVAIAFI